MRTRKSGQDQSNTYIDHRVKELIPLIESLAPFTATARKNGKNGLIGWKALAIEEARRLKLTYPDETNEDGTQKPESDRTYGTCLRQVTALKKALRCLGKEVMSDPATINQFKTIASHFGEILSDQFSGYKSLQNFEYSARVKSRSTEGQRIVVNLEPFIQQAHAVLSMVVNDEEIDWREVTCAIALVTGRRMAEILATGKFTKVSDYEVSFQGQLKGKDSGIATDKKGNQVRGTLSQFKQMQSLNQVATDSKFIPLIKYQFTIPTLVRADLVVAGIEYLAEQGKRLEANEDPEMVNRRWAKPLAERIQKSWVIVPNEEWQAVDPKDKMTFHKLRGAYFIGVMGTMQSSFSAMKSLAESILGDKDLSAIENYERFDIAPDTLTRI